MHGPPLTLHERAASVDRQVSALRTLGANLDCASRVVAERHHVSLATVTRLLLCHQREMQRRQHQSSAAA